jgi:hypothetical protein
MIQFTCKCGQPHQVPDTLTSVVFAVRHYFIVPTSVQADRPPNDQGCGK